MRRLVCHSYGTRAGMRVESSAEPEAQAGQVLVEITAANVAFVDRLIVRGGYQVRPPLPFTPGVVGAGTIRAVGDGVDGLEPGTRVVVLTLSHGVWATHVVVAPTSVAPIPDGVPEVMAAAAIEAYGTAGYALEDRGGIASGEQVLVLGAGGAVGHAAVEIAVHLGAEVIALTSDPEMWDRAPVRPHVVLDRGAVHLREAMKERFPAGIDMVLDPVGGDAAELALRSLGPRGRYLVVGFASGEIPRIPLNQVLLRNRSVIGVEWASWIADHPAELAPAMGRVLDRLAAGALHPPDPMTVSLDDLPDVLVAPTPKAGLIRTVLLPS
jgi:NADPH:quinone reductase